jgi:hypothetical protein
MNGSDPRGTGFPGRPAEGGPGPRTQGAGGGVPTGTGFAQNQAPQHNSGDLHAGLVLGKYQIVRRLGSGGMGSVYEAVHTHIGKSVALKTMNPALASDPRAEARFMREAAAASRLGHPNVVDVTDYGSDQGVVYIVMEILRGDDLSTVVQHAPAGLDAHFVADVMLAVCAGVFAAHEKGVVHRDLKPQNIFLSRTPLGDVVPKVLDFGISKILDEEVVGAGLTNSGSVMGTTHYLSPEQVTGMPVDGRSDEFALGVILFECLTGQRPHHGDTVFTIMRAISEGRFQRPRVLRPDMLPALEAVILRALALRPEDRFPTVHAMGNGLLPFATPRAQVMWGDYFARPPAAGTAFGLATGPMNPVYAPTPAPPAATMMMGPRAFASDTRSGSGVGPVSVIGTNELEQQRGDGRSRFRGLMVGSVLGAVAAATAFVMLKPRLPSAPVGTPPAAQISKTIVPVGPTRSPASASRGTDTPGLAFPKASALPATNVGKASSDDAVGKTAPPATAPGRIATKAAAETAPRETPAPAARTAPDKFDRLLDKYDEKSFRRDRAKAARAASSAAKERDTAASKHPAPATVAAPPIPPPKAPPAVRPKSTTQPADDDVIEGPRSARVKAPILE